MKKALSFILFLAVLISVLPLSVVEVFAATDFNDVAVKYIEGETKKESSIYGEVTLLEKGTANSRIHGGEEESGEWKFITFSAVAADGCHLKNLKFKYPKGYLGEYEDIYAEGETEEVPTEFSYSTWVNYNTTIYAEFVLNEDGAIYVDYNGGKANGQALVTEDISDGEINTTSSAVHDGTFGDKYELLGFFDENGTQFFNAEGQRLFNGETLANGATVYARWTIKNAGEVTIENVTPEEAECSVIYNNYEDEYVGNDKRQITLHVAENGVYGLKKLVVVGHSSRTIYDYDKNAGVYSESGVYQLDDLRVANEYKVYAEFDRFYNITVDYAEGKNGNKSSETFRYKEGNSIAVPTHNSPKSSKYQLEGFFDKDGNKVFYKDGKCVDTALLYDGLKVTARWTVKGAKGVTIKSVFPAVGGSVIYNNYEDEYTKNDKGTDKRNITLHVVENEGYALKKLVVKGNAERTLLDYDVNKDDYEESGVYKVEVRVNAEYEVYAEFERVYTVEFDYNHGSRFGREGATVKKRAGEDFDTSYLSHKDYSDKYELLGFYTEKNDLYEEGVRLYDNTGASLHGDEAFTAAEEDGTVKVYARWQLKDAGETKVYRVVNGEGVHYQYEDEYSNKHIFGTSGQNKWRTVTVYVCPDDGCVPVEAAFKYKVNNNWVTENLQPTQITNPAVVFGDERFFEGDVYVYQFSAFISQDNYFKATCEAIDCRVDFVTNGGSEVESVYLDSNTVVGDVEEPTKPGYTFAGWFKDNTFTESWDLENELVKAYRNAESEVVTTKALYAKWIRETIKSKDISAKLVWNTTDGAVITDASVELKKGNTIAAKSVSDAEGNFTFAKVLPGDYQIVVSKSGITYTVLVSLSIYGDIEMRGAIDGCIVVPDNRTSEVVVEDETPDVMVGGLDVVASNASIEGGDKVAVKLEVKKVEETEEAATILISAAGVDAEHIEVLDLSITSTVTNGSSVVTENAIHDTATLLEIVIPFQTADRHDFTVYRRHTDASGTRIDAFKPGVVNEYGEYMVVEDGQIRLFVRFFSTYAVTYADGAEVVYTEGYWIDSPKTTENGRLIISGRISPEKVTNTLELKADEGYKLALVSVIGKKTGKPVVLKSLGEGKYSFVMPAEDVNVYALFTNAENDLDDEACLISKYDDANADAWYHVGMHFCLENLLMKDVEGKLNPNGTVTRAEAVGILWAMVGSPVVKAENPFKDVAKDSQYYDAITWAYAVGVISGQSEDTFGYDDEVTREELSTILYNYAKLLGEGFTGAWMFLLDYKDIADISSWANEAVHWTTMTHITEGTPSGNFEPTRDVTRAETAKMFFTFCGAVLEN